MFVCCFQVREVFGAIGMQTLVLKGPTGTETGSVGQQIGQGRPD